MSVSHLNHQKSDLEHDRDVAAAELDCIGVGPEFLDVDPSAAFLQWAELNSAP
jgi:hypothetical protein